MEASQFFYEISDGMIAENIIYDVYAYVYTVHNSNPRDCCYNPPLIKESNTKGECFVEYYENAEEIVVTLNNIQNFDWNDFPFRFSSFINLKQCRIDVEEDEDVRTVVIPFRDMSDSPNEKYRMELMFEKSKLISIVLTETKLDSQLRGTMKSLQLIGELK